MGTSRTIYGDAMYCYSFSSESSCEENEVMGSPTSLGTQDSGITMETNGAGKELLAKVIQVIRS